MHVCGSHEQAIARYGLRAVLPRELDVIMGPGCPVCITDMPEVDEAVALALSGRARRHLRRHGARAGHGQVARRRPRRRRARSTSSTASTRRSSSRGTTGEEVVFFATGFETTAVATAAVLLRDPPQNFSVLSAHKYVPPAMEIVAQIPDAHVEGFLAAGHAAVITGWGLFEPFVERYRVPVVVAGFEPLDILAALVKLIELVRDGTPQVVNMYPRCVTKEGNTSRSGSSGRCSSRSAANGAASRTSRTATCACGGNSRTSTPGAASRSTSTSRAARRRRRSRTTASAAAIMAGLKSPHDCPLFGARVRARHARGRLHGEQRGHVPHLAPVRRPPPARGDAVTLPRGRRTDHAQARRRRPGDAAPD